MAFRNSSILVNALIAYCVLLPTVTRCWAQPVISSTDAASTQLPQPALVADSRNSSPAGNSTTASELVKGALLTMEKSKVSRWAYTMTSVVDGKKTVEKHDPSAPRGQRWELITKDGKAPTDAERREYAKKRKRDSGTAQFNLNELVDLASVKVEKDEADRLTCSLRMKGDGDEGRMIAEKVQGKLIVRKQTPVIESLELENTERIGKRGVFSLSEFKIRMQFAFDQNVGEHLPVSFSMRLRGRALLVKSLNSDSEVTFSDFRRPEKAPASPAKAD